MVSVLNSEYIFFGGSYIRGIYRQLFLVLECFFIFSLYKTALIGHGFPVTKRNPKDSEVYELDVRK